MRGSHTPAGQSTGREAGDRKGLTRAQRLAQRSAVAAGGRDGGVRRGCGEEGQGTLAGAGVAAGCARPLRQVHRTAWGVWNRRVSPIVTIGDD